MEGKGRKKKEGQKEEKTKDGKGIEDERIKRNMTKKKSRG